MRNHQTYPLSGSAWRTIIALLVAGVMLTACSLVRSSELRLADEIDPTATPGRPTSASARTAKHERPSPTPRATAKAATSTPAEKQQATPNPVRRLSSDTETSAAALNTTLEALRSTGRRVTRTEDRPDLRLISTAEPGALLMHERILTPVDRFSSLLEGISLAELRAVWTGSGSSPDFTTIYPSQDTLDDLTSILGAPGPAVKPQPADQVSAAVWGDPMSIGIVPFERLNVRLRALRLDGLSAVDNRLDQARWPLAARAWLSAQTPAGTEALSSPVKPQAGLQSRSVETDRARQHGRDSHCKRWRRSHRAVRRQCLRRTRCRPRACRRRYYDDQQRDTLHGGLQAQHRPGQYHLLLRS